MIVRFSIGDEEVEVEASKNEELMESLLKEAIEEGRLGEFLMDIQRALLVPYFSKMSDELLELIDRELIISYVKAGDIEIYID